MQAVLERMLRREWAGRHDRGLVVGVQGKPDFLTPEQAAKPKTWLGRPYAERLASAQGHKLLAAAVAGLDTPPDWLHGLLNRCVPQDATCDFGQPPAPLIEEIAAFKQAALVVQPDRRFRGADWRRPGKKPLDRQRARRRLFQPDVP